jgi:hypothetical protein
MTEPIDADLMDLSTTDPSLFRDEGLRRIYTGLNAGFTTMLAKLSEVKQLVATSQQTNQPALYPDIVNVDVSVSVAVYTRFTESHRALRKLPPSGAIWQTGISLLSVRIIC